VSDVIVVFSSRSMRCCGCCGCAVQVSVPEDRLYRAFVIRYASKASSSH